jgi:hypothetical protein
VWAEAEAVRKLARQGVTAVDRYNLAPAGCLAIWTPPPSRREFQAAMDLVQPTSLYLFGLDPEAGSPGVFLNRLAGLVKYAINSNNGIVSLPSLAAATGQRTALVLKGLEWLEARRHIQVLAQEGEEITINQVARTMDQNLMAGSQKNIEKAEGLMTEMKALLAESVAFRDYFARAGKDDLINSGIQESEN